MTILILASILTVSLGVADILNKSVQISKISQRSSIAFLAAETGAERILNLARNNALTEAAFQAGCDGGYIDLDNNVCGDKIYYITPGNADYYYKVKYDYNSAPLHTYTIVGYYFNTRRSIEVQYAK